MAKFAKFTDVFETVGVPNQNIFINPDHVRAVRANYDHAGGTLIQLEGQEIAVKEDMDDVIRALS